MKRCPKCGAKSEDHQTCDACGVTFSSERSSTGLSSAPPERLRGDAEYWRGLVTIGLAVALLAGLASGGIYWWKSHSLHLEAQRRVDDAEQRSMEVNENGEVEAVFRLGLVAEPGQGMSEDTAGRQNQPVTGPDHGKARNPPLSTGIHGCSPFASGGG